MHNSLNIHIRQNIYLNLQFHDVKNKSVMTDSQESMSMENKSVTNVKQTLYVQHICLRYSVQKIYSTKDVFEKIISHSPHHFQKSSALLKNTINNIYYF